jgi:hypothetical protein
MTRDSPGFVVFVFVVFLLNIKRTAPFSVKHLQLVVNKLRYASFNTGGSLLQISITVFLAHFEATMQCFMTLQLDSSCEIKFKG